METVIEELQRLHELQVIEPLIAYEMSKKEKLDALKYLIFVKKKCLNKKVVAVHMDRSSDYTQEGGCTHNNSGPRGTCNIVCHR